MAPAPSIHLQDPEHQFGTGGSSPTCEEATADTGATALDSPAAFSNDGSCHREGKSVQLLARQDTVPLQPLRPPVLHRPQGGGARSVGTKLMSLFPPLQMLRPTCQQLSVASVPSKSGSLARKRVVGTLYGQRKGRAIFSVQEDASSEEPLLLLELAVATGQLVKEMASGTVRILLECERQAADAKKANKKKEQSNQPSKSPPRAPLWEEPLWTMFCNGRRAGCAVPRPCGDPDRHVLRAVRAVSAGAGVLPPAEGAAPAPALVQPEKRKKAMTGGCSPGGGGSGCGAGGCNEEMMFMRARFERVVVSKDSEAFYMMSPNGGKAGSPELCIFLLRL